MPLRDRRPSRSVDKMFQAWRKVEQSDERACVARGFITEEHVERHCLDLMARDASQGRLPAAEVFQGLLLRVQSARSIRHGSLASVRWADVGWEVPADQGVEKIGSISVVVTKNLGHMSARQAVTSKIKSKLLAVDEISAWFFRRWCEEAGT